MSAEEYLKGRVDDQIHWYEVKSSRNKNYYYVIKVIEMVLAILLPFISRYDSIGELKVITVAGIIGTTIAIIAGLGILFKFHDKWIEYRTTVEALKHEQILFVTKAGPYKNQNRFPLFVERFEAIISKENTNWAETFKSSEEVKRSS